MAAETRRRGRPKSFNPPQNQNTIQALDRALDVLQALSAPEGMTLSRLAEHLDQSAATMHRVLATPEKREFVEMSQDRQTWHIGPEAFRLGSAFLRRSNVVERSRPLMRELMLETGETSNLGIEKDCQVLFVSQVETHESIRAFFPPGTLSPMHASGIGKALLGTWDHARLVSRFGKARFERFTESTIGSFDRLIEELAMTRERGYAVDDEERTWGMRCVAAPIMNVHGEAVAGISVSGPKMRLQNADVHRIGERVRRAAGLISRQMGAP